MATELTVSVSQILNGLDNVGCAGSIHAERGNVGSEVEVGHIESCKPAVEVRDGQSVEEHC